MQGAHRHAYPARFTGGGIVVQGTKTASGRAVFLVDQLSDLLVHG